MLALTTPLHAAGSPDPFAMGRAMATLGLGLVAFLAFCYLWYRDYHRWHGGEDA